ncbi:thermonuclease family protein [Aquibium sp. ELW1220]|uniref:thermonuclease family protein n=1 Tax=Aquibium sp. ELW1220 TaxID=2976766 RepID=UPI00339D6B9B
MRRGHWYHQLQARGLLALSDFVAQATVSCRRIDTDRYQRMVAQCEADGNDIGQWLVSAGWAMAYRQYSTADVPDENEARAARRGIWAGRVQPPWEWRRGAR